MRALIVFVLALGACSAVWSADPPNVRVRSLSFSSDGSALAAAVGEKDQPGRVVVWDAKTGDVLRDKPFKGPVVVRFAPAGNILAVGAGEKVHLLDVKEDKTIAELTHPKEVIALAFGPEGKLATSSVDGIVRIWDWRAQKELTRTSAYREGALRLAYSSDGKWLAGSDQRQAFQWNAESGKEIRAFNDDYRYTAGFAFSADGSVLLRCLGNDGNVEGRDAGNGNVLWTINLRGGLRSFDFAPTSGVVAASSAFSESDPVVSVQALRFTPPTDAERMQIDGLLKELDAEEVSIREAAGQKLLGMGVLVQPILKKAMAESASAEVRLRARKLRQQLTSQGHHKITAPERSISSLALAPDGKRIAVGCTSGAVHILSLPDGKTIRTLRIAGP